ncbi:putative esterase [Candidatus Nitrososphaera evergladensis SR1]|uniref:Putative esterase n=1 Tax=Candidatus Nitrososphaera evergladensis SR1 TaxID=1459636 RepID=A0A075MVE4_9ARCH|nr:alpha/beta hydrolase [Candidatus Nitrososphaera evergladensis]AIF83224.1 putative esterase [Candidatus Nitrososphaera evergladensis SR1]
MSRPDLGFIHRFVPPSATRKEVKDKRQIITLLLLHGTGGNEDDMIPLGQALAPTSATAILSPRGKVLENGVAPRFFKRLEEGVFDMQDLKFRTHELADFVEAASKAYGFDLKHIVAVGYSNGANIATSIMLLRPKTLSAAILFRPMVPLVPDMTPDLSDVNVFISAGLHDRIVARKETEQLVNLLSKAGAKVVLHWHEGGHELGREEIVAAKDWLATNITPQ